MQQIVRSAVEHCNDNVRINVSVILLLLAIRAAHSIYKRTAETTFRRQIFEWKMIHSLESFGW